MTRSASSLLLCLAVGSLMLLTLPAARVEGASDPDDESWATATGSIGLAGGEGREPRVSWEGEGVASAGGGGVDDDSESRLASAGVGGGVDDDSESRPGGGVHDDSESRPASAGVGGGVDDDSESRPASAGDDSASRGYASGSGDSSSDLDDSDYSIDDSNYGFDDSDYGFDDSDYGFDYSEYGSDGSDYGFDDSDYDYDDSRYGYDIGYRHDAFDYTYDASEYGYDGSNYEYDDSDYGYEDSDYGYDDSDYGYDDSDYGFDDSDYGYDDSDYGYDDSDYGFDDSDYVYDGSDYGDDRDYTYDDRDDSYNDRDDSYGDDYDDGIGGSDAGSDYGDDDDTFGHRRRKGRRNRAGGSHGRRRGGHGRVRTLSFQRQARSSVEGDGSEAELDDSYASPEDIPSGYFSQNAEPAVNTGGIGGPAVASGSIDFPGFRLVISDASEWWKYDQNVCLNKEFLRPTEMEIVDADMSMYTVRCSDLSTTEYACNITQWNGTVTTAHRLSYTCCRGYTRLRGDRGCPRKLISSPSKNLSFEALLRKHGYSQKIIDLFSTVLGNDTRKQWTVFMPAKAALDRALRKVDFRETREDPVPEWFVRTVLNHFAQPAKSTGSLRNGQLLPTWAKAAGGGLLITKTTRGSVLANCQPIVRANLPFNRYSLLHFTSSVLVMQQSNLYQLMLKRLESVVSLETAKKLLASIKSTLTGARPVTVFMHMPSREEVDNNCYARNLRSTIAYGVECNASISTADSLRTIDGKLLRVSKSHSRALIGGNRVLISADHLASNGVLHIVNTTESLTGYANEVTRRLKSSDLFRPLFARPGRTEASLALLIPPHNGSYSYANTSARWDNATELARFGRQHLLDNATAMTTGRSVRLAMLDEARRDFVQVLARQSSASIFGPYRLVRYRFVDCVPVVQTAKDCGGAVYLFLKGELPDFRSSPTTLSYLSSRRAAASYSVVRKIVQFALERNVAGLASRLRSSDASLVLLKDADMHRLSGGLLARRRLPTSEQMTKLTNWFALYLVASKQVCAAKSVSPFVTVPVFQIERRPCRSLICAFRRRVRADLRRVRLRPDARVTVTEGFLLPGQVLP